MEEIEVRLGNTYDLKDIQRLDSNLFDLEIANFNEDLKPNWAFETEGETYFRDMISNENIYVAVHNNAIVGYLAGKANANKSYLNKPTAKIEAMCISDEFRGLGIGKLLVNKFKQKCRLNRVERIVVTTSFKNTAALDFYKKNNFADYDITLKLDL